ncbi:hypothetical protein IE81DRAFT_365733 [Ceraceosorus guamensis]|uniref:Profilin n=1 Tax=Ceraceosorus guamensis TaxID=1522189 RepID=A0A316W131_9BASI|nr:hypothetical protein IE81DRAFT_365733 [Ceraceosorus guamensis]PWN43510.1 hypothetical protein IE81DRAFT_365733 [Ceraceosorus guamensis]
MAGSKGGEAPGGKGLTEATIQDAPPGTRKSLLSNFDFDELIKTHLASQNSVVSNVALFDKDDGQPVGATTPSFANAFAPEEVNNLLDIFTRLSSPAGDISNVDKITLGGTEYTLSGPRGNQYPAEIASLHSDKNVLFATPTATLLLVLEAAPGADTKQATDAKQAFYTAVKSFNGALASKGL